MQVRKSTTEISAFVICKDESATIRRCLESLNFCREIVVVDSGSTDGTLEIIRSMIAEGQPIRLIEQEWMGYARQKQFAMDETEGPWCLSLDADEYVDDDLLQEILALPLGDTSTCGYWMRRRDRLPGYGYPPAIVHARFFLRLVRKGKARFDLSHSVHESLSSDGPTQRLKRGVLMHERNMSVAAESAVLNKYSTLKARDKHARGVRTGSFRMIFLAVWEFGKSYVGQRYFVCGRAGIIHSMLRAEYALLTEAKLHRLSLGKDAPPE
ncbi:glycosyltransferase family 2 protein [Arvimicrobium flavum]|uniref:glycosyltransferase family 2 protein n=1 Tax=Arvimicrobium flavum TaxID=3393320 RepID=UPI00237AC150|nr:glycosyltransferase family 2 protein [Mesorhizobium shangrilense]